MRKRLCQKIIAALEKEPQSASDYAYRADLLGDYECYEAAFEDYQTALAMNPDEDFDVDLTWFELANTLQNLDRNDEALTMLEKLCNSAGNFQDIALTLRGKLLAETDPVEALKCFDKAIEIAPNDHEHHLTRLRFYLDTDQLDRATEAITETTNLLKRLKLGLAGQAELFELQGVLAMKQGRFADAVKVLTRAIWYNSSEEKYYQLRSEAHNALGNLDKADADRRKAETLAEKS